MTFLYDEHWAAYVPSNACYIELRDMNFFFLTSLGLKAYLDNLRNKISFVS